MKVDKAIVFLLGFWVYLLFYGLWDYTQKFVHLKEYERNAIMYPGLFRPQLNAAMMEIERGNPAAGLMYAQRAIKLDPTNAGAWMNAHSAAAGVESYHLAYKYGVKGYELTKPKYVETRKRMAANMEILSRMLGKHDEAKYYRERK